MKIEKIKNKMIEYRDLFGGSLINVEEVDKCSTKEELAELIDAHETFIEGMATDAQSALQRFKRNLGL